MSSKNIIRKNLVNFVIVVIAYGVVRRIYAVIIERKSFSVAFSHFDPAIEVAAIIYILVIFSMIYLIEKKVYNPLRKVMLLRAQKKRGDSPNKHSK